MPQLPDPPPLQSIETADALYTRVLDRGRRLRRERRAFLATAAMSFVLLAAAVPVALTNDDGSQVATTDRTRPTSRASTSTTVAEPVFNFPETTTTVLAPPIVQGVTATTARRTTGTTQRSRAATTTTPTTAKPTATTSPSTTTSTVVPISSPPSRCTATSPAAPTARGRVLFVRNRDIHTADLTTEPPTVVNLTQSGATESSPAWAPDGTRFVFVRDGALWTMAVSDPPGSAGEPLTAAGSGDSAPAWSWDGGTIAFVRGGNIWLVPSTGTAPTQAIDVPDNLGSPTWSPDSCRLAYTWRGKVLVSRTDGTGMFVVRDQGGEPSWSSTNRLAISAIVGQTHDIFVGAPAANAAFTRVTTGGGTNPSWNGDGDKIAFQRNGDIYAIDAGGGGLDDVSTDPADDTAPAW